LSNSKSWFWGTPKQSAYTGWFDALISGILIGAGIATILIPRWIMEGIVARHPTVVINPEPYAIVHLLGAFSIMIGTLFSIIGIYAIYRSQKTVVSQTQIAMEKKFCRYCGTENKKDAVFCEKCGKKISEG
jgi:ribosomal protein L40E